MRIPVYNAEGSVTREAPGRSIRARMDATPFIQAELRKGEVLGAAAQAAGEYANARYKVQVENDLNEAMLGAQETLRTRRDELAKSPNYNRVLDGDDPLWNRETTQIKNELRKKVGKNVYALTQFDAKFGQLELQNRFQLRNDIDRKIAAVAAANQAQLYVNGENMIADSNSLSEIDFVIAGVKLNGKRLVQLGLGKGETLSKQEYAMVLRGTDRALTNFISEQDNSILTLHKIRKVLETENAGEQLDPELQVDPEGQKIYHLLRSLSPSDQKKLIQRAGGMAKFVDGPTLYEQQQNLVLEGVGKQANDTVTTLIDNVTKGYEPSAADIENLQVQIDAAGQTLKPAELAKLNAKVLYFETVIDVAAETKTMNGNQLVEEIDERQKKENKTQTDINVLEYLKSRQSALIKGVNEDAMAWANDQGVITMDPVDYADFASETFVATLQARRDKGKIVQDIYQRESLSLAPVIMTKAETAQVSRMLNEMGPEDDLAFFSSVKLALGEDASILFDQLGDDNGFMSMLGMVNMKNSDAARQIAIGLQMGKDLPDSKISIKSLVAQNSDLSFLKIRQEIFTGIQFEDRGKNDAIINRAVEAMLTYQTQTGELSIDFAELNQEQFRDIVSFALGGSKDGETGGIGQLGDENNPRYYFRPDGVSDDDFKKGLESLQALHPTATSISSILDKGDFTVAMIGTDKNRQPVYALVLPDSNDPMDMGVTQFASFPFSKDPALFTFAQLVQQASFDAQATLKQENIVSSAVTGELKGETTQADVDAYLETTDLINTAAGRHEVVVENAEAISKMRNQQPIQADAKAEELQAEIIPVDADLAETAPEVITEDLAREAMAIMDSVRPPKQDASNRELLEQGRKILAALRKKYPWITSYNYQRLFTAIDDIRRLDSNAQPVGSVGGQVVEGQSKGITGGATDAEIEQLMGTDNAPEVATAQDDEALVVDRPIPAKRANTVLKNTREGNDTKIKVSELWDKNDNDGRYLRNVIISGFSEKQRQSPSFHIEILILKMRDNGWKITAPEAKKMLDTYKQENPEWFE